MLDNLSVAKSQVVRLLVHFFLMVWGEVETEDWMKILPEKERKPSAGNHFVPSLKGRNEENQKIQIVNKKSMLAYQPALMSFKKRSL